MPRAEESRATAEALTRRARSIRKEDLDPEVLKERTDEASKGVGFASWLSQRKREPTSPYKDLWRVCEDADLCKTKWNLKAWVEALELRLDPDTLEEAAALLVRAESEWRVDMAAQVAAKEVLEVKHTRAEDALTHREPAPLASLKCGHKNRGGVSCGRPTVPGSDRCVDHGGAVVDPETRRSMLMSAYASIVEGADIAVDTLIKVAQSGRNELARVNAAREILDRAGLVPTMNVDVTHRLGGEMTPAEALRSRLDRMKIGLTAPLEIDLTAPAAPLPEDDAVLVDAEVVDLGAHPSVASHTALRAAMDRAIGHVARGDDAAAEAEIVDAEIVNDVVPTQVPLRNVR